LKGGLGVSNVNKRQRNEEDSFDSFDNYFTDGFRFLFKLRRKLIIILNKICLMLMIMK
jgi:hypothetical protein